MKPRVRCNACMDPDRMTGPYYDDDRIVFLCNPCANVLHNLHDHIAPVMADVPMASRSTVEVKPSTEAVSKE